MILEEIWLLLIFIGFSSRLLGCLVRWCAFGGSSFLRWLRDTFSSGFLRTWKSWGLSRHGGEGRNDRKVGNKQKLRFSKQCKKKVESEPNLMKFIFTAVFGTVHCGGLRGEFPVGGVIYNSSKSEWPIKNCTASITFTGNKIATLPADSDNQRTVFNQVAKIILSRNKLFVSFALWDHHSSAIFILLLASSFKKNINLKSWTVKNILCLQNGWISSVNFRDRER